MPRTRTNTRNYDDLMEPNQKLQVSTQKLIWIVVAGTGGKEEFRDVVVLPGTQARDILDKLGLNAYQYALEKPNESVFDNNEDMYEAVTDGQKIYCRPRDVEAG
jgi:hypothetical protein